MFKIERVSKSVYGAIAQTNPVVNGNSAIIVTEKGLVFVDSQSYSTTPHSRTASSREIKDLPVRYLFNTDHHLDHAHGNAAYAKFFASRIDIISTNFRRRSAGTGRPMGQCFLEEGRDSSSSQVKTGVVLLFFGRGHVRG
jgi:glyoxylase-like metal-dependent hydrolase (beta-lactamase superfamily II)